MTRGKKRMLNGLMGVFRHFFVTNRNQEPGNSSLEERFGAKRTDTLSPDQLDEASSISTLVEPASDLITLVDVTPVNRTRNFHNFSLETPEFFDDLFLRLTSDEVVTRNRRIYRVQTPDDAIYWVLTRGR